MGPSPRSRTTVSALAVDYNRDRMSLFRETGSERDVSGTDRGIVGRNGSLPRACFGPHDHKDRFERLPPG
jgi:hypothetical protein